MIYRLHVTYLDSISFSIFIKINMIKNVSYDVTQDIIFGCLVNFQ